MNKRTLKALVKRGLFSYAIHPLFYIAALIFNVFCFALFFLGQNFFIQGIGSTDMHRFFSSIPYICVLIIPALILRTGGGSADDMIPAASCTVVLSRWISGLSVFCIMLTPLILVPICVSFFGDVELGIVFTGFIGIILYAGTALALSIFVSELIVQRPSAFIVSAVVLAGANSIHFLPLYIGLPSFVSDCIREISFAWHFDAAGKGILDTRDILFYLVCTVAFLLLTVYVSEKRRGMLFFTSPEKSVRILSLLVLFILFFVRIDSTKYYFRTDLTTSHRFTVSKFGQNLVQNLDSPLRITYYRSAELLHLYPQVRDVSDFLLAYASLNNKISLEVIDPADKNIGKKLESYGIQSQQLRTSGKNKTEYIDVYSAVVFEYLDKYEIIPFVLNTSSLEYDTDSRVQHLVNGITRTAALLCGNGLSIADDYSYVKPWLESQGFACTILSQQQSPKDPSLASQLETLPENTALVLFGSSKLTDMDASAIEAFVAGGRPALFAVSPYTADSSGDWSITRPTKDAILPLLSAWGISFGNQLVSDISCSRITLFSDDGSGQASQSSHSTQLNYPLWINILPQSAAPSGMTLYWTSPLSLYTKKASPLLVTSPASWITDEDKDSPSKLFETNPFIIAKTVADSQSRKNESELPEKGSYTVVAKFDGTVPGYYNTATGEKTKFIVVADQYFVDSLMMGYSGGEQGDFRNLEFLATSLLNLRGESELAVIQGRGTENTSLYKIQNDEEFIRVRLVVLLGTLVVVPICFLIFGLWFLLYRKRFNKRANKMYSILMKNRKES